MADAPEKKTSKKSLFFLLVLAAALGSGLYMWYSNQANRPSSLSIQRYGDGGYVFKINDKPYLIKGFCYNPIPIGKDFEYDFWADPGKPWLADGKLMREAGVNTIRIYRTGKHPKLTKQGINDLYHKFGVRTFVGHYLGFWDWPPANYANANFQAKMTQEVLSMVREYKSESGVIGWILGNENNYSFDQNVRGWSSAEIDKLKDPKKMWEARARIYYRFVNELAKEVKKIDPSRPVVMGIGEIKSLHIAAQETPDIDVLGLIAYRGATFGNLFRQVKQVYDKPVLMTEFGADRFNAYTREEDQVSQARFIELQWKDIERNSVVKTGSGNAIGGLVFEWSDEWWKGNEALAHTWSIHDQTAQWSHSAYYYDYEAPGRMNINEEWWGVVSVKPRPQEAVNGVDKRETTRAYQVLKSLWTQASQVVPDTGAKAVASAAAVSPAGASNITPANSAAPLPAETSDVSGTVGSYKNSLAETLGAQSRSGGASASGRRSSQALKLVSSPAAGFTWVLNGEPFWVKGAAYNSGPMNAESSMSFWSDPARPWISDARSMKQGGVNSIRLYATAGELSGAVLGAKDFYSQGIYTFMGHDLGFWSRPLTDYRDEAVRAAISAEVLQMVEAGKHEPGILAWILGNENNSAFEDASAQDGAAQAEAYFKFVNSLAKQIKALDPSRPVIMGLGETQFADLVARSTPDVDVVGWILYQGQTFGDLFRSYSKSISKPMIVLEYGADSYNSLTGQPDEAAQARYLVSMWKDLRRNTTMESASGVVVGGFVYEWVDQWWRADTRNPASWKVQDPQAQWSSAAYTYDYDVKGHLNVNEEWFGLNKIVPNPANPAALVTAPKLALTGLTPLWNQPGALSRESLGIRTGSES